MMRLDAGTITLSPVTDENFLSQEAFNLENNHYVWENILDIAGTSIIACAIYID